MPVLTHDQMKKVILSGGSVLYRGRIITTLAELPRPIELAGDDPRARAAVREDIEAQIAALQAQLADADAPSEPGTGETGETGETGGGDDFADPITVEDAETAETAETAAGEDLAALPKDELLRRAQARGLDVPTRATKDEIVALLAGPAAQP